MSGQTSLPLGISITPDQVAQWKKEVATLEEQMEKLREQIELKLRTIAAAETLFDLMEAPDAPSGSVIVEALAKSPLPTVEVAAHETYVSAVQKIVYASTDGIAPFEAKRDLLSTAFGKKLAQSEKGFYHAIERLSERGTIVRHNGRMFSPTAFEAFKRKIASGEAVDEAPRLPAHSPLGDAILEFVRVNPGVMGGEIIAHLRKDREFAATLNPHTTGAYNVIARLVLRRQLSKTNDKRYFLGKEAR